MNIRLQTCLQIIFRLATGLSFLVALIAALWASFCIQEKWRAQKAWKTYLDQKGPVPLSIDAVLPPIPRDEDNFAAIPMVKALFEKSDAKWFAALKLDGKNRPAWPRMPQETRKDPFSIESWSAYFHQIGTISALSENPASDVLSGLETIRPEMDSLRSALNRPYTRFPIDWEKDFQAPLPHFNAMMNAISLCTLEGTAQLALGNPTAATNALSDAIKLANRMEGSPILISPLVRQSSIMGAAGTLYRGLSQGQWSSSELPKLETLFRDASEHETHRSWTSALKGERALANQFTHRLLQSNSTRLFLDRIGLFFPEKPSSLWLLYPKGWIIFNQVRLNQNLDSVSESAEGVFTGSPLPSEWIRNTPPSPSFKRLKWLISDITAPPVQTCLVSLVRNLCLNRQAVLAVALEKSFQQNGQFPESLESLPLQELGSAAFDPVTRERMRYSRITPNSYRLWSVGENLADDQGIVNPDKSAGDQPDWVWQLTRPLAN
jgi:hypothetical protein